MDLTGKSGVTLEGTDNSECIIDATAGVCVICAANCTVKNLQLVTTGFGILTANGVTVKNCVVSADTDCFIIGAATNVRLTDCRASVGTGDTILALGSINLLIDGCYFSTFSGSTGMLVTENTTSVVVKNSVFHAGITAGAAARWFTVATPNDDHSIIIDNCHFTASIDAALGINIDGMRFADAGRVTILNPTFSTDLNLATGAPTEYNIQTTGAEVILTNCLFDAAKVNGTVTTTATDTYILSAVIGADSDTLETLSDQLDVIGTGSGATAETYAVTDSTTGFPIDGARVWLSTDLAGANVILLGHSNALGLVTFRHDLATGTPIYVWREKSGYSFNNPDTEVAS